MSEIVKNTTQAPAETEATATGKNQDAPKPKEPPKPIPLEKFAKGTLKLAVPIISQDKPIHELKYDYTALSGWEYVEAMDADQTNRNAFAISKKQALCLFAAAAAKVTEGLDAYDIQRRIGIADAQRAAQVSTVFLSRAGRELGEIIYGE